MPHKIVADSFHTKKLCSRLSSSKVRFYSISMAWTIIRPPGLEVCVEACSAGPRTDSCCCGCILVKSAIVTVLDSNENCQMRACCSRCCKLVDTHYQRTDLGFSFVTNFRYRLIRESLFFVTFSAAGMRSAYMGDGLYTSIYGICFAIMKNKDCRQVACIIFGIFTYKCYVMIWSSTGFQHNPGGLQFSTERTNRWREVTVGDCEISAKSRDCWAVGMLLSLYKFFGG